MKIEAWILTLWIAIAVTPSIRATTLISMSFSQLTQASSDIVRAQVVGQTSRWNQDHTQIVTVTTCEVKQTLKGHVPSSIEVEQPGGRVGNVGMLVPGSASFLPESEYVLFLEPPAEGSAFRLVGMAQGAYRVYQDALTHEARVILPLNQWRLRNAMMGAGNPAGTVPLLGFHKYVATIVDAGIHIPHGLVLPVVIVSTESRGTGRLHVNARTTSDIFPNANLVIPVGTIVEGDADRVGGQWEIHWDEVNVRGVYAEISASSQEPAGSLPGRSVVLNAR